MTAASNRTTKNLMLFWLSFADPHRARGTQFLGVAIVEASDFKAAIDAAWRHRCNPGGECRGYSRDVAAMSVPAEYRNRLLNEIEIAELEAMGRVH